MEQGNLGTVDWRAAFALFERWQAASPPDRPATLARLADENPRLAAALQALVRADAAATRDPDGLSFALPEDERVGSTVGAWRLERLLGRGGMGEVWLAQRSDALHQGQAAIKLLQSHQRSPAAQARFAAEARLLAQLAHPHIARLLDVGIDSAGQRHLVLEYVDGEPIDRWCNTHASPTAERLRLFLQVCDAVAHAHAHLIVHRDLKPSNILVDAQGQAKLLDFGVAKLLDDSEAGLTRTGLMVLTPEYAAPEQLTGEPITVATDVYALGVLLFELLAGRRPFDGSDASAAQRVHDILHTEPPAPSLLAEAASAPKVRGDLDHIVALALRKRPSERYASVRALADDVQRHLDHEPVKAQAPSWTYRAIKFVRRNRAAVGAAAVAVLALVGGSLGAGVLAAAVVFVALVGGSVAALWQARRAREAATQALAEAAKANATRDFLLGLFETLRVGEADFTSNLNRPVRDLLIDSGRQLLADKQLAPEVRLDLLSTIGRLHAKLSLLSSADMLESEAVALARAVHGPESDAALEAMIERGGSLTQVGRFDEARIMLGEVLAITERTNRKHSIHHARALHELGDVALNTANADAPTYLARAAAAYDAHHPEHEARGSAHVTLMRALLAADDFAAADREGKRIEALLSNPGHWPLFVRFYYESVRHGRWMKVGDLLAARAALLCAVEFTDRSLGARHPWVVSVKIDREELEHQLGDREAARAALGALRAAPRDAAVWDDEMFDHALARMALTDGDVLPGREAAARLVQDHVCRDDGQLGVQLLVHAALESLAGAHDAALTAARTGLELLEKVFGASSLAAARARTVLAETLQRANRNPEAGALFTELCRWADERRDAGMPIVARLRARALVGLASLGHGADAESALELAEEAQTLASLSSPVLDDRLIWAAARLAEANVLRALGRIAEARDAARSSVELLQRDQVEASPRVAEARALWEALG